jgi:formate dehydrogenase subunit delta
MKAEYLVEMMNDIGAFFEAESGHSDAPKSVASHVSRFWDPRMRREIIAHYQKGGGAGLSDVSLKAVALLAQQAAEKSSGVH